MGSGREGLTSLGTTTIDDRTAGTCAHTHAKTVFDVSTPIVRLECSLHNKLPIFSRAAARLLLSQAISSYSDPLSFVKKAVSVTPTPHTENPTFIH